MDSLEWLKYPLALGLGQALAFSFSYGILSRPFILILLTALLWGSLEGAVLGELEKLKKKGAGSDGDRERGSR
jgi:hypothetical protein